MNAWEIVTVIFAVLIVAGVAIGSIIRRKKGKSACRGDCSSCPYHRGCNKEQDKNSIK